MKIWIFLITVSMCRAQFSIQGPSDGHRQAAGLKISQEKGVEYVPHKDSINAGGFSIQGATDGNSNFQIQGATDGNSNFHIQGATDANANFQIQGPTDGGSNTYVQGAYDANQAYSQQAVTREGARALEYKDPSGLKVNWRSFARNQPAQQQQYQPQYQQPAPQYAEQPIPQRRPVHRQRQPVPQAQPQVQQHQPQAQIPARPLNNAPERIKQLLLFQQQIPYINSIPEQFRYDGLANAMAQAEQFRQEYPKQVLQQLESHGRPQPQHQQQEEPVPRYRTKARPQSRAKRQAPQQQQQHGQPQYRRIAQPPPEAVPNYSTNLPSSIQQLLKFQAQIPYDIFANKVTYKVDQQYVPQPVQQQQQQHAAPAPAPAQTHAPVQQNQYQSQLLTYNQNQGQGQAYGPRPGPAYPNYNQAYAQQNSPHVRPVTERQY